MSRGYSADEHYEREYAKEMARQQAREDARADRENAKSKAEAALAREKDTRTALAFIFIAGGAVFAMIAYCAIGGLSPAPSPPLAVATQPLASGNKDVGSAVIPPPQPEVLTANNAAKSQVHGEDDGKLQPPKDGADTEEGLAYAGRLFAVRFITPILKSPATASFPRDTVTVHEMPPYSSGGSSAKRWSVRGGVDSQNSFGALLRSNWEVTVLRIDEDYIGAQVMFDGQVVTKLKRYDPSLVHTPTITPPATKPEPPPSRPTLTKPDAVIAGTAESPVPLAADSTTLDLYARAASGKNQPAINAMIERRILFLVTAPLPVKVENRGPRISYVVPIEGDYPSVKSLAVLTKDLPGAK